MGSSGPPEVNSSDDKPALASSRVDSGEGRRQAATVQPACAANASPADCASAAGREAQLPLSMMAALNSPRAGGELIIAHIDRPPPGAPGGVNTFRYRQSSVSDRGPLPLASCGQRFA